MPEPTPPVNPGLLCVSASAATKEGMREEIGLAAAGGADAVELRLDALDHPDPAPFFSPPPPLPLLVTCRPRFEGGNFGGSEAERLALLCRALRLGASWVDIELRAAASMRRDLGQCRDASTQGRLIFSWHDFTGTPDKCALLAIYQAMQDEGADIGKIVTTPRSQTDVLRVLSLLEHAAADGFPLSAFCMGNLGRISRLVSVVLGGFMTYACLAEDRAAAPGQLSLTALKKELAFWGP